MEFGGVAVRVVGAAAIVASLAGGTTDVCVLKESYTAEISIKGWQSQPDAKLSFNTSRATPQNGALLTVWAGSERKPNTYVCQQKSHRGVSSVVWS